jgi:hypothetical protein
MFLRHHLTAVGLLAGVSLPVPRPTWAQTAAG